MKLVILWPIIFLSGCADYRPIAGMPQNGDPRQVASECVHEAYDVIHPASATIVGPLIGGALGGALAGSLDDTRDQRNQLIRDCIARHGWVNVREN